MARQVIANQSMQYDGTGSGQSVKPNWKRIDENFAELYDASPKRGVALVKLSPGSTAEAWIVADGERDVTGIELMAINALNGGEGSITVSVQDSGLNHLLPGGIDGEGLTPSYVEQALNETPSRLVLEDGVARVVINSTHGTATGGPVLARLTYAD